MPGTTSARNQRVLKRQAAEGTSALESRCRYTDRVGQFHTPPRSEAGLRDPLSNNLHLSGSRGRRSLPGVALESTPSTARTLRCKQKEVHMKFHHIAITSALLAAMLATGSTTALAQPESTPNEIRYEAHRRRLDHHHDRHRNFHPDSAQLDRPQRRHGTWCRVAAPHLSNRRTRTAFPSRSQKRRQDSAPDPRHRPVVNSRSGHPASAAQRSVDR